MFYSLPTIGFNNRMGMLSSICLCDFSFALTFGDWWSYACVFFQKTTMREEMMVGRSNKISMWQEKRLEQSERKT